MRVSLRNTNAREESRAMITVGCGGAKKAISGISVRAILCDQSHASSVTFEREREGKKKGAYTSDRREKKWGRLLDILDRVTVG